MQLEKLHKSDKLSSVRKQIYILDDDESVRRSIKLMMESYGFEVDEFSSAEEFFRSVPNSAPGCLILDIHLEGLNGWQTLQRLMETGSTRPVVVITADRDESFKQKALKAGAVGFLRKPFEDHYLRHMVNRVFNQ